ncbi:MAG TPA: DUF3341 domain-containing protein [Vulgatibacter sp.]|nr:DUF3341 domain-containing protein [Vulgatibacter sp.]
MNAGLLAEFESSDELLEAARAMRRAGFTAMDAFTPFAVGGLDEILEIPRSRVPLYSLVAGILGGGYAYLIQYWMNGFDYALNVGGRPLGSVPAFIPPSFEGTVLLAALTAVVAFLGFSGLPQVSSPIFTVDGFERASVDRFFLGLEATDPAYDAELATRLLREAGALRISGVPSAHRETEPA